MKSYSYLPALLFAVVNLTYVQVQPSTKPNVIYILADDIGYDVLGVNGGQSYSTPNLDAMARLGMNFTHCESTPLCFPSRLMLLTGKQNFRNYSNWGYMSDTVKTIGNLMRDAGYNTAFYGKLQLQHSAARMQNWGWNRYTVFEIVDDTVKNINRYKSPNLVDNNGRVPESIIKDKYCDDILTTRILNFIDNNKTTPFFIYYSMSIGHDPFCPTPDDPQYAGWDPFKRESDTSYFPSMVKFMNKKVGQILDKLRQVGLDNNTIVFFAGDNGTPTQIWYYVNGQRVKGGKGQTRESGTHVPLIAYMPSYIAPNSKNDDLIDFTDFFPTLADLAHNKELNKYGTLDGASFYNRLFKKQEPVRSFIFSHYNQTPGYKSTFRWVRDKVYKLYDTTEPSKHGKFYNIKTDPKEIRPLLASTLTSSEKALKATFRNILDTTSTWLKGPLIKNAAVVKVNSNSAIVSATIVDSGATRLIERGTTLSPLDTPFYYSNHLPDDDVGLGAFSQTRNKLLPQKKYYYSLYAMNANPSNSTSYSFGTFYTLSNPPLKQPTALTATAGACTVKVNWNKASFPTSGANKGGYLLFYSAESIVLSQGAFGKAPFNIIEDSKTRMINLQSTLPALPAITTTINGLSPDTLYHFTLVPYTYDGVNDLTYNYLTSSALTITRKPNSCSASLVIAQQSEMNASSAIEITPNPSRSGFTLKLDKSFANEQVMIRVSDVAGKVYMNTKISGNGNYTFGGDLKPGIYFLYFSGANQNFIFKVIKEQ